MIEYRSGNGAMLDEIEHLWEKLRALHVEQSTHFIEDMAAATFGERKKFLLSRSGTPGVRVDMAIDPGTDTRVGYCISSVDAHKKGEVDSLYVEELYRGQGIGEALMHRAIAWLHEQNVQSTIIGVAAGNEDVFGFYARFGFYPRATLLAQPKTHQLPHANPL
jgi:diamine N-acetyltransferase